MATQKDAIDWGGLDLQDRVVHINRCTKVVKGGKNLSFSALVVVGDGKGIVGYGMGKAREVPSAISKGIERAKRNLIRVPLVGNSIPHAVLGRHGAGQVLLRPATEGTGIIAGGSVRAVLESAGVRDVLTKSLGSNNPHNVVRATFRGLLMLRSVDDIAKMRGKEARRLAPYLVPPEAAGREAATETGAAAAAPTAPQMPAAPEAGAAGGPGGGNDTPGAGETA